MPTASIFMKFGSIQGDAQEDKHKKWIVLNDVEHAVARDIPMSTGYTEQDTTTRYFGDISVTKRFDIASTALMNNCLKGSTDTDATIDFSYVGDNQPFYEEIKLTQALVTQYGVTIDKDGNGGEAVTLTFVKYDQEFGEAKASLDRQTQEMG
jgi:type VI secretion system secreted protein Hcp